MKKTLIAAAVVLAAGMMTACGDTNYCYEVTSTYKILGIETSVTNNYWGTKNELKTYEQNQKDAAVKLGADESSVSIKSKRLNKSESDCLK